MFRLPAALLRPRTALCVALVALCAACSTVSPESNGAPDSARGGSEARQVTSGAIDSVMTSRMLLVVRLERRTELPRAIAIDIATENGDSLQSFVATIERGLSKVYGDYTALIALAPGAHRIRAIREAGARKNGVDALLARTWIDLPVAEEALDYVGRLVISGDETPAVGESVRIEDHFDEDMLLVRTVRPDLRDLAPRNRLATLVRPVATDPAMTTTTLTFIDATPAIASALAASQRPLFRRFLAAPVPKAFAVGSHGAAGFASGEQASSRALQRCQRRGDGSGCRLLAIDNTLVAPSPCASADNPRSPQADCSVPGAARR